ncbi:hypothetical protein B0H10DRAFT_2010047 [Mycena sp. CBHHK59/15]|nr:hypothetical protein B0H10DRAFT_2010047 [Mycena sp. CBHHK59/15]
MCIRFGSCVLNLFACLGHIKCLYFFPDSDSSRLLLTLSVAQLLSTLSTRFLRVSIYFYGEYSARVSVTICE